MNRHGEELIASPHNARVKSAANLHKKHARDLTGSMLIEGIRELALALEGGIEIETVFSCPDVLDRETGAPLLRAIEDRKISVVTVGPRAYEKLVFRDTSGGLVAVARQPSHALSDLPAAELPLYLVADGVEKPGNLGALLRTADAAGVTGLIASDRRTDLYNPNVIRASLGTVFAVPIAVSSTSDAVEWLGGRGIAVVAATPDATTPYTEADLAAPAAIVVGREDLGLGAEWLKAARAKVRIPMKGSADSLNVSVAAAVLLFEALRQRAGFRPGP
jgi:TrmH family RNA methyltransferase